MEFTAAEAWSRILEHARPAIPEASFRTWLEPTEPLGLTRQSLTVGTRDEFAAEWLQDKYGALLQAAAVQVLGAGAAIAFRHQPQTATRRLLPDRSPETAAPMPSAAAPVAAPQPREAAAPELLGSPLNDRYTFERFVVGDNNEFAAASCRAVADTPARMYNPLFIYGGVGLGKTHLMHAIGHRVLATHTGLRVVYVSSEQFTNDLIASIQGGRMAEFRRRYRYIDLLLIDDVQFLGDKERTQEEFFHTFNAVYDARGQIVLTSDRPPKDIPGLEERLVSRFEWGLVTDIKPPAFETRAAIIRKKADEDRILLQDDVIDFIAKNCRSSVRELEGAIIKLLAYSSLTRREIDIALTREALGSVLSPHAPVSRSPEGIRSRVADEWHVTVEALISRRRSKDVTVPRHVAMYLMRRLLDRSLVHIGHYFGGRDHSTILHAFTRVEQEMASNELFRNRVLKLLAEFEDCG